MPKSESKTFSVVSMFTERGGNLVLVIQNLPSLLSRSFHLSLQSPLSVQSPTPFFFSADCVDCWTSFMAPAS